MTNEELIRELKHALVFTIMWVGILVISICGSKYYEDFIKYIEG